MQPLKWAAKTIWHRPLGILKTKFQRVMVRSGTSSPDKWTSYHSDVFYSPAILKPGIPIAQRDITQQFVIRIRFWDIMAESYPWFSGLQGVMVRVGPSSFEICFFEHPGGDSRISARHSRITGKLEKKLI